MGKDPGFGPEGILAAASRTGRYASVELSGLDFDGSPPDAETLGRRWRSALGVAREIIATLPTEHAGTCVLDSGGSLFRGGVDALTSALATAALWFHPGSIGGALPRRRR